MIVVYIAGPFSAPAGTPEPEARAHVEANIDRAVELGVRVAEIGCYPLIPHANTRHPAFEKIQPYKFWIEGTLAVMRRACDALILTSKWETSSGATAERADMIVRSKPVFETIEELDEWAKWYRSLPR